jgi:hypothetical protein
VRFEVGRAVNGQKLPIRRGDAVSAGQAIYVDVDNCTDRVLYASVFNIGVAHKVTLLTTGWPSGVELDPKATYTVGRSRDGGLAGLGIYWPIDVPKSPDRLDEYWVLVTGKPRDLRALETAALENAVPENPEDVLRNRKDPTTRDARAGKDTTGWFAQRFEVSLRP